MKLPLFFNFFFAILHACTMTKFKIDKMKNNSVSKIAVRYAETDQMGVVHHSIYAQYFEIGRLDWLNQFHIHYHKMEQEGVMLPVYDLQIKYHRPIKFGENIFVNTSLKKLPDVKIQFVYRIFNEDDQLVTSGSTTLVFVDAVTRKPIKCPTYILEAFKRIEFD